MSNLNNNSKSEILLESGTNEIEIMEFTISGQIFGINVAKIKEIMRAQKVKEMPNSHDVVEGIFKPRDEIITVVNLGKYLCLPEFEKNGNDIFIITHFNSRNFAFHVESVVGINRISWEQIKKPDDAIFGGDEGVATGITEFENRLITIIDFEKIIAELSPQTSIQISSLSKLGKREENDKTILIAEDSELLSRKILECLHKAGYTKTIKTSNGKEAWEYLNGIRELDDNIINQVSCVVTDIEMPLMDGHRLTKLIKDDEILTKIPVIIFSSLISEEMKVKGQLIGADGQISKPEIDKLVYVIDDLTSNQ